MPIEPPGKHEGTYVVQDRNNTDEMTRLEIQDKMFTLGMGGVLPELADPTILQSVLDIGCGTGDWLIEVAKTYPTITKLVGGDINDKILDRARTKAQAQQLDKRVRFKTMDALRVLEFRDGSFDLVNQRFGVSWLRTWDWQKLLVEYQRVARLGGIIRITEINGLENNSPALTKLNRLTLEATYHSGHCFAARSDSIVVYVEDLMRQYGIENVQTRAHTLFYRPDTIEGQYYYQDVLHWYRVGVAFLQKYTNVPSDYEKIYQQALEEMQQPDFVATMTILTVWGTTPTNVDRFPIRTARK